MRLDKVDALKLRESGKSYKEISEALKVPRSTLSGWFGKEDWSKDIKNTLIEAGRKNHTLRLVELNKTRGVNLGRLYKEAVTDAKEEFENLKYNPLFIAALMLYWGEGDKVTRQVVKLTNTDAEMMKLFTFFLKNVCQIPIHKIRAQILVYPDLEETECLNYWAEATGIPPDRFIKSSHIQGRHKTRRLGHGICMVYVSSTYFKVKILEWLKFLPKELMNREYYENIEDEADIV